MACFPMAQDFIVCRVPWSYLPPHLSLSATPRGARARRIGSPISDEGTEAHRREGLVQSESAMQPDLD